MVQLNKLNDEHIYDTIKNGEFADDIISSNPKVAIIMTQDWCPQWRRMQEWVSDLSDDTGIKFYEIIYNKEKYFNDFRIFKENKFKNGLIPYVRYYKNGAFVGDSNYV